MRGIIPIIGTALGLLSFVVFSVLVYSENTDEVCVVLTFDADSSITSYEHNMSVDKNGYGVFSDSKKIALMIYKEAKIKFDIDKVASYSIKEGAC